jgi:hypothetical protein
MTAPRPASSGRFRREKGFPIIIVAVVIIFVTFQIVINGILFSDIDPTKSVSVTEEIQNVQNQVRTLQRLTHRYVDDGNFYPFTIRDSQHLVPTQIDRNFHVFDYVDLHTANQLRAKNTTLVHNGKVLECAPCFAYSTKCYKQKILQVFHYVLDTNSKTTYFFYMESDNDLCVGMSGIRDLAYRHERYFLSTGVGFSGWIMSRQFMLDFLEEYGKDSHGDSNNNDPNKSTKEEEIERDGYEQPDLVGSNILVRKKAWAVTRTYLVSHTILPSRGEDALMVAGENQGMSRHLPRCFEPRRDVWKALDNDSEEKIGWDYFDYRACAESDIFPCRDGQLD